MIEQDQAIPKPPRLIDPSAAGPYDWREFDRFLQRLYALLGNVPVEGNKVNIFNGYLDNLSAMQSPVSLISTVTTTLEDEHSDSTNVFAMSPPDNSSSSRDETSDLIAGVMAGTFAQSATSRNEADDFLTLYWIGV